jgi:hypothetical protein
VILICPWCRGNLPEHDYLSGLTVVCEDCGEHAAEICPTCGKLVDLVLLSVVGDCNV